MKNGIIITFEGPDGAGKTTVLEKVLPVLQEKGYDIVTTREPGGVEIAERIRTVRQSCYFIWQQDVNTM